MCIRDRVGAGGTGSHVLRRLANMHLAMVELGHPEGLDVLVVDPDTCLLYTSDAADERSSVDLGGRRIIKKKNKQDETTQR